MIETIMKKFNSSVISYHYFCYIYHLIKINNYVGTNRKNTASYTELFNVNKL